MSHHPQPSSRPTARKRLTFFVARKCKVTPERTGSVRRSQSIRRATIGQSRHLPAPHTGVHNITCNTSSIQALPPFPPLVEQQPSASQDSSLVKPSIAPCPTPPHAQGSMSQVAIPSPPPPRTGGTSFIRRLTKKLKRPQGQTSNPPSVPPVPSLPPTPTTPTLPAPPAPVEEKTPKKKGTFKLPPLPRPQAPTPNLTNAFTAPGEREAALRARGLVPARYRDANGNTMPLSQQEQEMDRRFSVLAEKPGLSDLDEGESEAKRIREAWLRKNEANGVGRSSNESRKSALDSIDDDVVIGKGLSPRRPTIMLAHASALTSPSKAEVQDCEGQSIVENPADIPLPPSPSSATLNLPEMEEFTSAPAEVDEKVSKWLESTPTAASFKKPEGSEGTSSDVDVDEVLPSTPSSTRSRKQRPPPIVTSSPTSSSSSTPHSQVSALPSLPNSPPSEFEDPRSPREALPILSVSPPEPSTEQQRGRTLASIPTPSQLPALSPTRTASSGMSEGPRTPIAPSGSLSHLTRMRKTSSASGSSAESRGRKPPRRSTGNGLKDGLKIQTTELEDIGEGTQLQSTIASVIVESPIEERIADEDERPSENAVVNTRPRSSTTNDVMERRRSITLGVFGRSDNKIGISSRASSSMTSLRRNFSKLSTRPKSSLIVDTASANKEGSANPVSPTSTLSATSPTYLTPRSRQPLSPKIHSRGSILMETKAIEDEESRRLSELAFLDF